MVFGFELFRSCAYVPFLALVLFFSRRAVLPSHLAPVLPHRH